MNKKSETGTDSVRIESSTLRQEYLVSDAPYAG